MKRVLIAGMLLALASPALVAQGPIRLQLATMAPSNSVWEKHLRNLATAWQKSGRVRIEIFPGRGLGNEDEIADEIRHRPPTPQIAALSAIGLSHIDPAFSVFGMPFFFESYEELYGVLDAVTPMLRQRLDGRGLVHLAWGHVGWAHMFSTKPVRTLDQLKKLPVWTSGDVTMVNWYRSQGFTVVQSSLSELTLDLRSGKIGSIPTSPLLVSYQQWYTHAKYMLDVKIAPIIGAVVVAKPTWEQLSEADRAAFRSAAEQMERELEVAVPDQDRTMVQTLQKNGQLTVITPEGGGWRETGESLASLMRSQGGDVLDAVRKARDAYRTKQQR
jgi:TRAP-type C4-dicarboxylate transport system substrate-binding protein